MSQNAGFTGVPFSPLEERRITSLSSVRSLNARRPGCWDMACRQQRKQAVWDCHSNICDDVNHAAEASSFWSVGPLLVAEPARSNGFKLSGPGIDQLQHGLTVTYSFGVQTPGMLTPGHIQSP